MVDASAMVEIFLSSEIPPVPGHVRHDVIGQLVLQDGHKLPPRVEALSHVGAEPFPAQGVIASTGTGSSNQSMSPASLQRLAQPDGRRHVAPPVRVDEQLDLGPASTIADVGGAMPLALFAHLAVEDSRHCSCPLAPEVWEGNRQRGCTRIRRSREIACSTHGQICSIGMAVQRDVLPDGSPQQLVNRLSQRFALDVPQGNVDPADRVARRASRAQCR